jgi:hypothetical protein
LTAILLLLLFLCCLRRNVARLFLPIEAPWDMLLLLLLLFRVELCCSVLSSARRVARRPPCCSCRTLKHLSAWKCGCVDSRVACQYARYVCVCCWCHVLVWYACIGIYIVRARD